jgi:glycosyltransferase involved in cell wall biosynthesis
MSPAAAGALTTTAKQAPISLSRRVARYPWRAFLRLVGEWDAIFSNTPSPQLLAWVRDFQPEVIYGHCAGLNRVLFLRHIQQALGLPLVLHIMDDFPEVLYRNGLFSPFMRPRYLAEFSELVGSANVAIAICKEMAEEYERRYRRRVTSLSMPVELDAYQTVFRTQWTAGRPFRLQFGGRVGWALRESLVDIAHAVSLLQKEGAAIVFDILTFEPEQVPAICHNSSGVTVQRAVPTGELPRRQAEADVLVICLDFDGKSVRQAKYSMPSKTAGCMASGTPILVYGPAGSPVVEYARREGWGRVVDRRDPVKLRTAVRELMESAALRERLGSTARRLAIERHDAKAVSENLRVWLQNLAVGNRCDRRSRALPDASVAEAKTESRKSHS